MSKQRLSVVQRKEGEQSGAASRGCAVDTSGAAGGRQDTDRVGWTTAEVAGDEHPAGEEVTVQLSRAPQNMLTFHCKSLRQ